MEDSFLIVWLLLRASFLQGPEKLKSPRVQHEDRFLIKWPLGAFLR